MLMKRVRKLYEIDPRSWEHPADRAALAALRQVKGLDELIKTFLSITTERGMQLMHYASSVKVGPTQYPKINTIIDDLVETFDWPYRPTVFVTQSPFFNAHTFGAKEPWIVLNSSILRTFDEEELRVVVAHEFGHVMSGHAMYKTLIWLLANVSLSLIPGAQLAALPVMAALSEWDRKSELSADRAALLATQVEEPSYRVLMRMAGGEDLSQVNLNDFFAQAREFEDRKDLVDTFHKILNQLWLSHPHPVTRLSELKTWASSGLYATILDGMYLKREHRTDDPASEMKEGFDYYKRTVEEGEDPLSRLFTNLGKGIEHAAGEVGGALKDLFKQ